MDSTDTLQSTTPAVIAPSRIRFDDFIVSSNQFPGKEVQKCQKYVGWFVNTGVLLTPAILCEASNKFPEGIEWLRRATADEILYPDLHGWTHGPYGDMPLGEVREHLEKAQVWFKENLGAPAIRWVTPHGSDSATMREAAAEFNLVIETTEYPVVDQKHLDTALRKTWDLRVMEDRVIMTHWFYRGLHVYRTARIIEHQSVEGAIEATRSELGARDHKICWGAWEKPRG